MEMKTPSAAAVSWTNQTKEVLVASKGLVYLYDDFTASSTSEELIEKLFYQVEEFFIIHDRTPSHLYLDRAYETYEYKDLITKKYGLKAQSNYSYRLHLQLQGEANIDILIASSLGSKFKEHFFNHKDINTTLGQ